MYLRKILNRYPGDNLQDVIKVELGEEGSNATAEINNITKSINIIPPAGMTPEQTAKWEVAAKDVGKLTGLANKRLAELHQQTDAKSNELFQKEKLLNQREAELQEKQRKLDQALTNLDKKTSNSEEIQPLWKFIGLEDASKLPNFINDHPDQYLEKTDERLKLIAKQEANLMAQANQSANQLSAIQAQATIDGLDMSDFINNYCIPQGIKSPTPIAYQTYKQFMKSTAQNTQAQIQDISKYAINVMPSGSHAQNYDNVSVKDIENMSKEERANYRKYLDSQKASI